MAENESARELQPEELEAVNGGTSRLGVYRPGFRFKREALDYFRHCVGEETYLRAMSSDAGRAHHYVAARVFLTQAEWERFVWIEEHGSLAGFPG